MQQRRKTPIHAEPGHYEEALNRLYPGEVKKAAKRASELGLVQGMHLYGRMLQYEASQLKKEGKAYEELQTKARELVIQAAKNGCWGAMDDLGTEYVEELNPSMPECPASVGIGVFLDLS